MNFDLKLGKAAAVLFLALAMAGCGGGGDTTAVEPPPPAPIDMERMAISDALDAASAAAAMVTDTSSDDQVSAADMAVAAAMAAIDGATLISSGEAATSRASLATIQSQLAAAKSSRMMVMDLANQRMAISDAIAGATTAVRAVNDDSDDATVTAAEDAIAAATRAIDAASQISNQEAVAARMDVADLQSDLDDAKSSRQMAMDAADQMDARRTAQLSAITTAINAATTAVAAVDDDASDEEVNAATQAIADANAAIAAAADVSADVIATHTATVSGLNTSLTNAMASRNTAIAARKVESQRTAISDAIGEARTAVMAVTDTATDEQVMAADDAITAAKMAIAAATDVPADERAANTGTVSEIETALGNAKMSRTDAIAEAARMARIQGQRDAISNAIEDAKTKVAAVNDESTDEQVMAADDAITAATAAIAAGTDLPMGETDMATETVSMLATTLTGAKSSRELAMGGAARDMRNRIIGKDRAVEAAANLPDPATDAPLDGNLDENDIRISRAAGKAASVRVRDPAGYSASDTPAMSNPGWAGAHLERSIAGAKQHLFVYTDIGPPTRIQFYDFDRDLNTPARYTDGSPPSHTNPYGPGDTLTPVDLATTQNTDSIDSLGSLDDNFMSPGPAEGGDLRQTFRLPSSTATSHSFKGNFQGAPGTYTCTAASAGTDCVLTITPTGNYFETSGTWTFTPELNSTAWRNDTEFMSFGWWLQEPTSPNGAYTFRYYADGNVYTAPPGTITTGTATYTGRAAGKYVVQTIEDGGVTGGVAHQFTAAATLTASFDAAANSISGTISGFTADDGSSPGWEVTLHRKTLGAQANLPNAFPAMTETDPTRPSFNGATATIGDETAYGDWTGQYFGDQNAGNARNAYPLGVGGTFQADNEAVSIGGAFGARR